jgi:HlyD family secretion protein
MPTRALPALAAFCLGLLLPGASLQAAEGTKAQTAPPAISVIAVKSGTLSESALLTGTLVARDEVLVSAEIDGYAIVEILAEEGDKVAQGQVLARLNRQAIDVALTQNAAQAARAEAVMAQAKAQISEAEANRQQAENSFGRAKTLREDGIVAAETYDQRQAAARAAVARVNNAREALNLAEADKALADAQRKDLELRLARSEIRAPVAGIISRRTARQGAIAAAAGDALFRIIKNGIVEVEADVAETVLARLKPQQKAAITVAGDENPIVGHVRLVSPEVNRTSRLGRVRITLGGDAVPAVGSFARASVEIARANGFIVPISAVFGASEAARVQVVVDGKVVTRSVRVGARSDGKAVIVDGLSEGDAVIALAGTFVREGDRVTPIMAQAPSN